LNCKPERTDAAGGGDEMAESKAKLARILHQAPAGAVCTSQARAAAGSAPIALRRPMSRWEG